MIDCYGFIPEYLVVDRFSYLFPTDRTSIKVARTVSDRALEKVLERIFSKTNFS